MPGFVSAWRLKLISCVLYHSVGSGEKVKSLTSNAAGINACYWADNKDLDEATLVSVSNNTVCLIMAGVAWYMLGLYSSCIACIGRPCS